MKEKQKKKCKKHELKYPNQCIQPDLESMVSLGQTVSEWVKWRWRNLGAHVAHKNEKFDAEQRAGEET